MEIRIEYCAAWSYEPKAVSLTEQLLSEYKQRVKSLTLTPHDDGRFEVFVDGKKIYSKKATGRFPEYEEIRTVLQKQAA